MNITIEYIFINPDLNEIKNITSDTIKCYIENMVIVIGEKWNINKILDFLIKERTKQKIFQPSKV